MDTVQYLIKTQVGKLYMIVSYKGLQKLQWTKPPGNILSSIKDCKSKTSKNVLTNTIKQLQQYFARTREAFDIPLDLQGTEFQKSVWKELTKIPFGKTVSYKDVAEKIKKPKACRAVGSANGKNPIVIIVPCHRVIASDGSIGGYSAGLNKKKQLLTHEKD